MILLYITNTIIPASFTYERAHMNATGYLSVYLLKEIWLPVSGFEIIVL